MRCFSGGLSEGSEGIPGMWRENLFCRLKIKIQNKLISLQTPFLPSLPSQVHYLLYFGYKNEIFTNFSLTFTNFILTSSELGDLVKNRIKKKIYIRKNICNGGELGNFAKIEKFTDLVDSRKLTVDTRFASAGRGYRSGI
jgi:hypothetical protein